MMVPFPILDEAIILSYRSPLSKVKSRLTEWTGVFGGAGGRLKMKESGGMLRRGKALRGDGSGGVEGDLRGSSLGK